MLQITPPMKILVAVEPADFRRGIDGLARLCQESLEHDPFTGAVFVFRNRRATALKLLMYDGQGFWLCHADVGRGDPRRIERVSPERSRPQRRLGLPRCSADRCSAPHAHRG